MNAYRQIHVEEQMFSDRNWDSHKQCLKQRCEQRNKYLPYHANCIMDSLKDLFISTTTVDAISKLH